MRIILLVAALVLSHQANAADFQSRNSADIGFTTNANLTSDDQESDLYYRFISRNSFSNNNHRYAIRFGFTDYLSEHQNDLLSLRLEDTWGSRADFEKSFAIIGQLYPNGEAATTESAFDSLGLEFNIARDWTSNSSLDGDWGSGYRFRFYPSFDNRNDHTLFGFISANYDYSSDLNFGLSSEGGLTYSSLSDYSRIYFDVSGSADLTLANRWSLLNELTLSHSRFLNRDVTSQVAVTNKGKSPQTRTFSENEKYLTIYLSSEAMREQTDNFSWGGGVYLTQQSSTSDTQDYSALELMGKLIYIF